MRKKVINKYLQYHIYSHKSRWLTEIADIPFKPDITEHEKAMLTGPPTTTMWEEGQSYEQSWAAQADPYMSGGFANPFNAVRVSADLLTRLTPLKKISYEWLCPQFESPQAPQFGAGGANPYYQLNAQQFWNPSYSAAAMAQWAQYSKSKIRFEMI